MDNEFQERNINTFDFSDSNNSNNSNSSNNYSKGLCNILYSDTFNTYDNVNILLYCNLFNNNFADTNFMPDSEPLFNDMKPFNNISSSGIPNYNIPNSELSNNISHSFNYRYSLAIGDYFDDWLSVDAFIHQYCLERDFGYQIFHSDKDSKDPTIICHKSF